MHSISIVDVGHGNCAVIRSDEKCVVIDAASKVHLLKYLEKSGITQIDLIILSHSDQDHIAGLQPVLSAPNVSVKCLVVSSDSQKHSEVWKDLRALIDDRVNEGSLLLVLGAYSKGYNPWSIINDRLNLEIISPTTAMALAGSGMSLPNGNKRLTSNSISIVVRVIFDNVPVALLTGDMDRLALDEVIQSKQNIEASYLVFPHHGGLPGSSCPIAFTNDLVSLVKPKAVIFSNGRGRHSNPRYEIVTAVKRIDEEIYISCTQLSEACCKTNQLRTDFPPGTYAAGAESGSSCSGTLEIDLASLQIDTARELAHRGFVQKLPEPLCMNIIARA